MTMREAHIHLPVAYNDGSPIASALTDAIASLLLSAFGGYTMADVKGAWRCPKGHVYAEPMTRLTIAAEWTDERIEELERIAAYAADVMDQECIYLAHPAGVSFVAPSEERKRNAA